MTVKFLGLNHPANSERQNHKDWALEIISETDFEQTFFNALFDSSSGKTCSPKASLLWVTERGVSVMVEREDDEPKE